MSKNSPKGKFSFYLGRLVAPVLRRASFFFPDWLVLANFGVGRVHSLLVSPQDLGDVLQMNVPANAVVDVLLTADCCLEKTIPVPVAAAAHGNAVVDVFLRQSLPANGKGMVWRAGPVQQVRGTGYIAAYVLKHSVLKRIEAQVLQQSARLRLVRVHGDMQIAPFVDYRSRFSRPARFWVAASLTAYVSVCGHMAVQAYQRAAEAETQVAVLQAKRLDLVDQAAAIVRAAQSVSDAAGSLEQDLAFFMTKTGRSQVLADLTALVPDDIWLSDFSLSGNTLRVSGYTPSDVVGLISTLQAASWVKRANLDGPVLQAGFEEGNSFELLIDLEPSIFGAMK